MTRTWGGGRNDKLLFNEYGVSVWEGETLWRWLMRCLHNNVKVFNGTQVCTCMWELDCEEGWAPENWCFWTVVLEKTLESPLHCKEIQPVHSKGDQSWGVLWKDWCLSWNSSTLATSCEELIHWKRLWCWEGLWAGGEGDDRGWDGWMASLTQWMWVWVISRSWWWTGRPDLLRFMGSQRVGHWVTELNWTELKILRQFK